MNAPQATYPLTRLLAHADLVMLAAALLHQPGSSPLPDGDDIHELLDATGADHSLRISLGEAILAVRQTAIASQDNSTQWSDEYHRLFEGGMACPPNESAFVRRDKGAILADIMGFYRAFGFTASPQAGEKPDHLCCELEFIAALLVMQSQAGNAEQHDLTRAALAEFAEVHLGTWLESFTNRLQRVTMLPVYAAIAAFLTHAWRLLAQQHGWKTQPQAAQEPDIDDSTPYECAMAEANIELTIKGRPLAGESAAE